MSAELGAGTPLAARLQDLVQSKLVELELGTEDDSALAEYIVLMVANGKTQDQISSELATDFLAESDGAVVTGFAQWLSSQVTSLTGGQVEQNGLAPQQSQDVAAESTNMEDASMDDAEETQGDGAMYVDAPQNTTLWSLIPRSPSGPRSMRNGPSQRGRDKRMMGQLARQMDRRNEQQSIHKIRGTANSGRINTHAREPPKGPTPKGPRIPTVRGGMNMGPGRPMGNAPGMPANSPLAMMTPQQQMQLLAMYEEQARVMAQILQPGQAGMNPGMGGFNPQADKSMFERVDSRPNRQNGAFNRRQQYNGPPANRPPALNPDSEMTNDATAPMDVEAPNPSTTICRFNLTCTRPDCIFVHQSPAVPPGTAIDMDVECTFGAACRNKKCVGKHPSPAQKGAHHATQECRFYPNCTNPVCPFRHPSAPPCRNGADCSVPGCTFSHSKIVCKFNPCLNPQCVYKHAEGQKRGKFGDKVWSAGEAAEHVSERRFVDDSAEELILPGGGAGGGGGESAEAGPAGGATEAASAVREDVVA